MSANLRKGIAFGGIALLLVAQTMPLPAFADDESQRSEFRIRPIKREPIKGQVSVQQKTELLTDDDASKLRATFATPQAPKYNPLSGKAAAENFNLTQQFAKPAKPFQAGLQSNQLSTGVNKSSNPDNAPYIWCQSVQGGYYDASGTTQEVVPGFRLKDYGGKFADGTPVPRHNVKMNEAGHVWWENDLSRNFVKRRR